MCSDRRLSVSLFASLSSLSSSLSQLFSYESKKSRTDKSEIWKQQSALLSATDNFFHLVVLSRVPPQKNCLLIKKSSKSGNCWSLRNTFLSALVAIAEQKMRKFVFFSGYLSRFDGKLYLPSSTGLMILYVLFVLFQFLLLLFLLSLFSLPHIAFLISCEWSVCPSKSRIVKR